MVEVAHWIGAQVAVQGDMHELSRVLDPVISSSVIFIYFFSFLQVS